MSVNLSKYFVALLLLFSVSIYSYQTEAQVLEECPVDLVELELQAEVALPVLGQTLELVDGLLVLLEPIQALDALGLLDPLVGLLLEIADDTTALIETLELFLAADVLDDQCALALDICIQSQGLFDLIGLVPAVVDDTLAAVLPLPILGDLLSGILDTLFGLTDFLLGTLQPVLGDLIVISCSQAETPVQECDFIAGSPVCADPACAGEEIAEGLTCEDFNENPEEFCDNQVSCDDPNCAGTEACSEELVGECTFINGSPDCSDEACAQEEVAEGLTCEDFNQDPEGHCDNEVSCDDPNCVGTAVCDETPGNGTGLSGGGCNLAAPAATATAVANFMLLLLLPIAGGYFLRRVRSS